jgi:hypothetical protein
MACTADLVQPSATVATNRAEILLTYAINLPDPYEVAALAGQYPDGVRLSPVAAQAQYDRTAAYGGTPNVYAGPGPVYGQYQNVGIVIAPYAVASQPAFRADEWPDEYGRPLGNVSPETLYVWVGRFATARVK